MRIHSMQTLIQTLHKVFCFITKYMQNIVSSTQPQTVELVQTEGECMQLECNPQWQNQTL